MKYLSKVAMVIVALLLPAALWAQEPTTSTADEGDKSTVAVTEIPVTDPINNFIRNGDFADGKSGWKGGGTVVDLDGKKAWEIKMRFSSKQTLSTNLRIPSNTSEIQIYFGIKLDNDAELKTAAPVKIYFVQGNLITSYNIRLKPGEKRNTGILYPIAAGTRDLTMQIEVNEGSGSVFLYNFVGVAKNSK